MWAARDCAVDSKFASIVRCKSLLAMKYKKDKATTVQITVTAKKERPILLAIFIMIFRIHVGSAFARDCQPQACPIAGQGGFPISMEDVRLRAIIRLIRLLTKYASRVSIEYH